MLSMERFSDWLLKELKTRDMTQSELAHMAGLGSGTISNIMIGKRQVGQDTLVKIAHALKLPPETVFRAAGLLPPESQTTELIEQIAHLTEELPEQEQQDILEFVKLRHRLAEQRGKNATQKTPTRPLTAK